MYYLKQFLMWCIPNKIQENWKYQLTCWKYFDAAILLTTFINFFPVEAEGAVILETNTHFHYTSADLIHVLQKFMNITHTHTHTHTHTFKYSTYLKDLAKMHGSMLQTKNIQTTATDISMEDSFLSHNSLSLSFRASNCHTIWKNPWSFARLPVGGKT